MAIVTDEMLMAYADGALSAFARAKVEAFLQVNPEARRRVEIFRATGVPLSKLYGKPMSEAVPAHLKEFVLNYSAGRATKAQGVKERLAEALAGVADKARLFTDSAVQWLTMPAAPAMRCWQLAAASAALVALGASASVLLHEGGTAPSDLVAFEDGRIFASGDLKHVLETLPSGEQARIGISANSGAVMKASLTFKSKDQSYCREYEIAFGQNRHSAGLGCRDRDGRWVLEVHLPAGGARGAAGPAGADSEALDAIVDRMMDGDALGMKEEAAAISNGWR